MAILAMNIAGRARPRLAEGMPVPRRVCVQGRTAFALGRTPFGPTISALHPRPQAVISPCGAAEEGQVHRVLSASLRQPDCRRPYGTKRGGPRATGTS